MQAKQRVLTGITTTGTPHLGNYLGALKPAVAASQQIDTDSFYFLADYHALIKCQDPQTPEAWEQCKLDCNRYTAQMCNVGCKLMPDDELCTSKGECAEFLP